jgi:hypothetical protein
MLRGGGIIAPGFEFNRYHRLSSLDVCTYLAALFL